MSVTLLSGAGSNGAHVAGGAPPGARLAHAWSSRRLVVLAYHDVQDVDAFRQQADYLRNVMTPVTLGDVLDAQGGGRPLPARAVLVTFDDGDRTVYEHALPILQSRGIPSVVFVIAGLIGTDHPAWFFEARELVRRGVPLHDAATSSPDAAVNELKRMPDDERREALLRLRERAGFSVLQPQLTASELRAMEAAGMLVGSHTDTHPCLDRCSDAMVEQELTRAHDRLTEWLGHAPRAFAYPNGNGDPRVEALLGRLGYEGAFLFDHRIGAFPAPDRYRISRVRVNSTTGMRRFRHIVTGLHPFVHHAIGRA